MNRMLLVFSYVATFGVAIWLGERSVDHTSEIDPKRSPAPARARSQGANPEEAAQELIQSLLATGVAPEVSQYEQIRATLDGLENNEARVLELVTLLPEYYIPKNGRYEKSPADFGVSAWAEVKGPEGRRIAEFEARIAHWLRTDRDACMGFLKEQLTGGGIEGAHPVYQTVLADYLAEGDFRTNLRWIAERLPNLVTAVIGRRIQSGAGLELLDVVKDLNLAYSGDLASAVAPNIPFSSREKVLEMINSSEDSTRDGALIQVFREFIRNSVHPSEELVGWLGELADQAQIPDSFRRRVESEVAIQIMAANTVSYEKRIEALEKWNSKLRAPYDEMVKKDLWKALEKGRDLAFEFRHGRLSAEDVWQITSGQLPQMNAEAEKSARVNLFRTLVEEDPQKARVLIDSLPLEEQKAVLYNATTNAFDLLHPQKLLDYTQQLPPAENDRERQHRIKGWEWKTMGLLARHGQDYVDWVTAMPEGPDREEAKRGLVWGTMRRDPVQGDLLRAKLYKEP